MLLILITVALAITACGRATDEQINQALGITPTPTPSQEDLATSTAIAQATEDARLAAQASPSGAAAVALGDVTRGRTQFQTNCMGCHGAFSQTAPKLLEPGGVGVDLTIEELQAVIRDGEGHPSPPGPYPQSRIADSAIRDLYAYILSEVNK
jgi:mono/diheme cytochrome c family protein